jgi:TetR/AcrR family transcriptional repressor of mexJK operon
MVSIDMASTEVSGTQVMPPKHSKARGRKRSDVKRDRIVRSAAKLFLDKGYESVSINDIIKVVGGSKATIYSNFSSKEKLFEAVVEQMCAGVTLQIDARPTGTIDEQLTRIASSFLSKVLSPPILRFHRLMTSIGRTFPAAGRLFYGTGPRTAHQIIADWIAVQQREGNIRRDEDSFQLAVLFHDMLIGDLHLSWLTSASSDTERTKRINQKVRLCVKTFLQGCAPR